MQKDLEVTAETVITLKMSKPYASKLAHSLGRALEAFDHLGPDRRTTLVNTRTVDDLLALKTALFMATE